MYVMRIARDAAALVAASEKVGYFDKNFDSDAYKVLPGEFLVTDHDVMLVTVLGSCVSACIRDPIAHVGGMNHFMLPEGDPDSALTATARYGAYAMEVLINELAKMGGSRRRMEAKVFGGGAVLPGMTSTNVGESNGQFVLKFLAAEGIRIVAQDLYGVHPRRVHYFPMSGKAMVKHLPSAADSEVVASERLYQSRLRESPTEGSVELF